MNGLLHFITINDYFWMITIENPPCYQTNSWISLSNIEPALVDELGTGLGLPFPTVPYFTVPQEPSKGSLGV